MSKKFAIAKLSGVNEYAIVRLNRFEMGTDKLRPEDPRRMRYYVRATSDGAAVDKMAARFPNEQFYVLSVTKDVETFPWEGVEIVTPIKTAKVEAVHPALLAETLVAVHADGCLA